MQYIIFTFPLFGDAKAEIREMTTVMSQASEAYPHLVTATDVTMWIGIVATVLGLFAAIAGVSGAAMNQKGLFNAASGLLLVDGVLVIISVIFYWQAVGSNITDLGIDDLVKKIAGLFGYKFDLISSWALDAGTKCDTQQVMKGTGFSIVSAILVLFAGAFIGFAVKVDPPQEAREGFKQSMQMKEMPPSGDVPPSYGMQNGAPPLQPGGAPGRPPPHWG